MDLVVAGLVKERRNVLSRLRDHERLCRELELSLVTLDATLKHFGHKPDGSYIPKQALSAGLFYTGELPSMVLRILRDSGGLTLPDLLSEICRQKGWETDNQPLRKAIRAKVTKLLNRKRTKGQVERLGDKPCGVWQVKSLVTETNQENDSC